MTDEWNKITGELVEGDEVTVNGELAGDEINVDSFWAIVKKYTKDEAAGTEIVWSCHGLRKKNASL